MENLLGEIRVFGFGTIPKGWFTCAGQTLAVNQYQALFSLLGASFGGDGINNFKLPDYRGVVGLSTGPGFNFGQPFGQPVVSLTVPQLASHNHLVGVNEDMGNDILRDGDDYPAQMSVFVSNPQSQKYAVKGFVNNPGNTLIPLAPDTIGIAGGGQPHANLQPYLGLNICIAWQGVYPSRP